MNNVERYLSTYAGGKLVEKHSFTEEGVWNVKGEDPNCDWGPRPDLGTYQGKLEDIIEMAVELPGFWQWGSGGTISKTNVLTCTSTTNKKREEVRNTIAALEKQLAKLRIDLSSI